MSSVVGKCHDLENRLIHKFLLKGDLIQLGSVSCFHLFDGFLAIRAKTWIRAVSGSHCGYVSPSPVQTFGFNTLRGDVCAVCARATRCCGASSPRRPGSAQGSHGIRWLRFCYTRMCLENLGHVQSNQFLIRGPVSQVYLVAMVHLPDPDTPQKPCPVLTAWAQLDAVLQRVATCGLLTYTSGRLTRQTCIDNGDLLIPVIDQFGPLPAFQNANSKVTRWARIGLKNNW